MFFINQQSIRRLTNTTARHFLKLSLSFSIKLKISALISLKTLNFFLNMTGRPTTTFLNNELIVALKRKYQNRISYFKQKKNFRFTRRIFKQDTLAEEQAEVAVSKLNLSEKDLLIENLVNETIVINETTKQNLLLQSLTNCKIIIEVPFKSLFANGLSNCTLLLGVIAGGAHLTKVTDSTIKLCTHQLRIHESKNTLFSVLTRSSPIIEHCSSLTFRKYDHQFLLLETLLKVTC